MEWWESYLYLFVVALVVALIATPFARKLAFKLDAVDYPGKRRINKKPIPRMGGVAIFVALAIAAAVQYWGTTQLGWRPVVNSLGYGLNYPILMTGFVIIFATGVIDDVNGLTPGGKLAGQLVAAIFAAVAGLVIGNVVNPVDNSALVMGWLSYPITVLYLVAYVNVINLIDGLDGLATGISCIAGFTMFILSIMAGRLDAAALSIALAGATLGFLRYNFHPASIFLGDSGSLLLGYSLGVISLLTVRRIAGLTTMIVPIVVAGIPIMDTFSAIIRRKRAHVSVSTADRGHIHHRLIDEGFDQKQAVVLIYGWTAMLCGGSIIMTQVELVPRIAIFVMLVAASFMYAARLHLFRPVLLHHYNPDTGEDELVSPGNPAFEEELEAAQEERAERREERREHREERVHEIAEHLPFGHHHDGGDNA